MVSEGYFGMKSYTRYKIITIVLNNLPLNLSYSQNYLSMNNRKFIQFLEGSVILNGFSRNYRSLSIIKD